MKNAHTKKSNIINSNALTLVEERLRRLLEDCGKTAVGVAAVPHQGQTQRPAVAVAVAGIPHRKDWLVTMWHFGADASVEYSGEKFLASWEIGEKELLRVYSKEYPVVLNGVRVRGRTKIKVRIEEQQYPQETVEQVIRNILYGQPPHHRLELEGQSAN